MVVIVDVFRTHVVCAESGLLKDSQTLATRRGRALRESSELAPRHLVVTAQACLERAQPRTPHQESLHECRLASVDPHDENQGLAANTGTLSGKRTMHCGIF